MIKKILKGITISAAALGMFAGVATAADYDINLYGASAQHKFWLNLAPDYLAAKGCATINQYAYDKKHGMAVGENCNFPAQGDNIKIRYSSRASYDGIQAVYDQDVRPMCNDDCSALIPVSVNLGASDVAADSFVQSTSGWEDGNQSFPGPPYYSPDLPPPSAGLLEFNPIVVPFGFLVNNMATEYICTRPTPADGPAVEHKAFNKKCCSCVPDSVAGTTPTPRGASGPSSDCMGFYKCLGWEDTSSCSDPLYTNQTDCETAGETWTESEELGTCNGGLRTGLSCDEADDCPDVALEDTYCKEVPVQNITQTMARNIFSGRVNNWADFGPEYPDCLITRCMRHAGSGTHATMDLAVMQGIAMISNSVPVGANPTWHFTSSSDLTKCVTDIPGAIGYVDVDKLLTFEEIGDVTGAHVAKYNGVCPSRRNIVYGLYEFWAAQHVYYNPSTVTPGSELNQVVQDMAQYSSNPDNLTTAQLGNAALYWAAQSEMQVTRPGGDGTPILH